IINARTLDRVKKGALLINTSRGGPIDTEAALAALKCGRPGGNTTRGYEQGAHVFFRGLSNTGIQLHRIQSRRCFPNVIVTGHQAFFTREALGTIMETTLASISDFAADRPLANEIHA